MNRFINLLISSLVSIFILVLSFYAAEGRLQHSEHYLSRVIAEPVFFAGMFSFGSGDIAFWTVIVIEFVVFSLVIWLIINGISSLILRRNR